VKGQGHMGFLCVFCLRSTTCMATHGQYLASSKA